MSFIITYYFKYINDVFILLLIYIILMVEMLPGSLCSHWYIFSCVVLRRFIYYSGLLSYTYVRTSMIGNTNV